MNRDREGIERTLRKIIADRMANRPNPDSIPGHLSIFRNGLGLDSLSGVQVLVEIEKTFQIRISDDDFDIFDSLEKMVEFVIERINADSR